MSKIMAQSIKTESMGGTAPKFGPLFGMLEVQVSPYFWKQQVRSTTCTSSFLSAVVQVELHRMQESRTLVLFDTFKEE